jgi:DnaJ-class molecular chaperone
VRVKIGKHETFQRRGADLVVVKKISLLEALTGVTMEIKHLDGKKHIITTSPGDILHNEELKTIRGLGLPFYKDPISHGNLIVEFIVQFPKKGTFNTDKLITVLNGRPIKSEGYSKSKANKMLEAFREEDLNAHPAGADSGEYEEEMGSKGGRQ